VSLARTLLALILAVIAIAAVWIAAPIESSARIAATAAIAAIACGTIAWLALRRVAATRRPRPITARRGDGDDAVLTSLGIEPADGELRAACSRVARRIHNDGVRVVGFVPAADTVAVPAVLIQLGVALTELTGATIAVVDANVRYPGLGALNRDQETDSDESVFSTRWLYGSLALLSPPRVERAGQVVPQLARALLDGSDLFEHVLVDLTGFELLGEHASAAACMDAVALVGRAHHTREKELLELARLMPAGRFFGVLLVG
jgi:hypothetical protein